MKKIVFIVVVTFLGLLNVKGQENQQSNSSNVLFGVKGGVNFATGINEDVSGLKGKTSFHLGGVVNINVSEFFSVQPELIYSSQGAKWGDYTLTLDYINVPIMADFNVADGLSLQAGPQIGFNVSSKYKEKGVSGSENIETVKSIDFGVGGGAQYKLPNGIFFQARYMMGLNDVIEDIKGQNKVFSLSVGKFF